MDIIQKGKAPILPFLCFIYNPYFFIISFLKCSFSNLAFWETFFFVMLFGISTLNHLSPFLKALFLFLNSNVPKHINTYVIIDLHILEEKLILYPILFK